MLPSDPWKYRTKDVEKASGAGPWLATVPEGEAAPWRPFNSARIGHDGAGGPSVAWGCWFFRTYHTFLLAI